MLAHFGTFMIVICSLAFLAGIARGIVLRVQSQAVAKRDAEEKQADRFRRIDRELSQVNWEEEKEDKEV